MKKIKLEDVTIEQFALARRIVKDVVTWQTERPTAKFIIPLIVKIKGLTGITNAGLYAGLYDGLYVGLDAGLYAGLDACLDDGLRDGLYDGLDAGLNAGLHAGLRDGLYDGLYDGLRDGLDAGLYDGLRDGLDAGLYAGLDAGLYDGLRDGLYAGLDAGLDDGLRDGLRDGKLKGKLIYCGVFWSWWLCRYLIAWKWGCKIDLGKLCLLYGFCRHTPIILAINNKIIVAKPTKIKWVVVGKTRSPFEFPIYELHGDGESSVECAGLSLYYWHNTKIPSYIGSVKSSEWNPDWVLTEQNQEVKRILLENIPSEKVTNVLNLKSIDTFITERSHYELVEAQNNPYPSRYRALRFKCPTTERPYLVRVHPDVASAETAIVSLNKGIHPDRFIWEH